VVEAGSVLSVVLLVSQLGLGPYSFSSFLVVWIAQSSHAEPRHTDLRRVAPPVGVPQATTMKMTTLTTARITMTIVAATTTVGAVGAAMMIEDNRLMLW
jgi:hypothetical protein